MRVTVTLAMPEDLRRVLRAEAERCGASQAEVVIRALEAYLNVNIPRRAPGRPPRPKAGPAGKGKKRRAA